MLIKIKYFFKTILLKSELESFEQLEQQIKNQLKLTSQQQIQLILTDPSLDEKIIQSNENLEKIKENCQKLSITVISIIVNEINNQKNSQQIIQPSSSDDEKKEKKIKKTQKRTKLIKEIVNMEIKQQIPKIIQQIKNELQEKNKEQKQPTDEQKALEKSIILEKQAIHSGFTCDGCETNPILGVRYKCYVCPDYDLCEKCEAKEIHNHHAFIKIKNPEQAPKVFVSLDVDEQSLQFLNQQFSNGQSVVDINIQSEIKKFQKKQAKEKLRQQKLVEKEKKEIEKQKKEKENEKKVKKVKKEQEKKEKKELKQDLKKQVKETQEHNPQKIKDLEVENNSQIVAQVVGGKSDEYSDLCNQMKGKKIEEIIEYALQFKKQGSSTSTPQEFETSQGSLVNQDKINDSLMQKAMQVAEIMGGSFQDYINMIKNLDSSDCIQDIIENLLINSNQNVSVQENGCFEQLEQEELLRLQYDEELKMLEQIKQQEEERLRNEEKENLRKQKEELEKQRKEQEKIQREEQEKQRREEEERLRKEEEERLRKEEEERLRKEEIERLRKEEEERLKKEEEERKIIEKQVQLKKVKEEKQKKIAQKYTQNHIQVAKEISNILGGEFEDYLQISKVFSDQKFEYVINMIIDDSTLLEKHKTKL
ncbi:zinc ZZ type family protein, putative [Ichthyophthirius multifiliis]|uniref:Zinc ZZ type family protein, putative n=1 Tax=Ichthyophthirius multifiliis TaxID=5932 RepID=G0R6C0_ICHMU|nr:zinc ZZ type family protein, putative [Ichthyophthirius multifiliis]EGR26986.1 zinc ZZ type family protein, putative [Ichthyophthirius multifiliis]|eukprot:XP_004023870.1 zinc ZZ type family protein, putative [Ichthyophthirius multifiliis]